MKIGFLGLGIMGSRMAGNLLEAGHDLVVWNRTRGKAESLLDRGAAWAGSPAAVADRVALLFTMLAHPAAVAEVSLGQDGFLDGWREGALWVDCSTVDPAFSQLMAGEANLRGIRFVDAPVTGTRTPAEEGKLLFLVGGADDDVAECRPYFEVMGREMLHMGGSGSGTAMKMVFNLLLGEAMVAFAEGLVLGQALGIPRQRLLELLVGSPVAAPFVAYKRDKIETGDYSPDFPLRWMRKDLHLASLTAYEKGTPLAGGNLAKELFTLAAADGLADKDFAAVYRFLAGKAGLPDGDR